MSHLQCAHIISRRYATTRTDLANAFCLDAGCHLRFTEHADEWMAFIDRTIGRKKYAELKSRALHPSGKVDWIAEAERLATIHQAYAQ